MYVSMYVCMYVCMCVCVCIYVYMCVCMYVCKYVCVYVYMYVCMYMYVRMYWCAGGISRVDHSTTCELLTIVTDVLCVCVPRTICHLLIVVVRSWDKYIQCV